MSPQDRARVVAAAIEWLGTPYHHEGGVKGAGADCALLLATIYHDAGLIPAIDPRPYPPDWHLHRAEERYLGWLTRYAAPVETPWPGDVALFRFGRCFSHGAIVIEWPRIIHAFVNEGVVWADATLAPLVGREVRFFTVQARPAVLIDERETFNTSTQYDCGP